MNLTDSPSAEQVVRILVNLHVENVQVLYIMLSTDGDIHRMGTGSESNTEQDLYVDRISNDLFEQMRPLIVPELFHWIGQFADPKPRGNRCRLTVAFCQTNGNELVSEWEYGLESQGPPREIGNLVRTAVAVTDPWYQQQKSIAHASR